MKENFDSNNLKKMAEVYGEEVGNKLSHLASKNAALAKMILNHGFSEVIDRPGLSLKYREIATLAVLVQLGVEGELRTHVGNALRVGISKDEINELLIHLTLYVGYPKVVWAQQIVSEELEKVEGNKG